MRKMLLCGLAMALALSLTGCAITDYTGIGRHQTQSESKLWGSEVSFITGDPALDGTYAYTVKYNNFQGGPVTIFSYRNPVDSSFSRDGIVDRDGDDVQGRSGVNGGKFLIMWVAVDTDPTVGNCGFFANITQDKSGGAGPLITFCTDVNEEIDKDLDLQASFANVGDLLSRIWSGAVTGGFTAEVTGVKINGVAVPLAQALSIDAKSNGFRPIQYKVDLTRPGGRELVGAILDHTTDGVPVTLGLSFDGGMTIDLPRNVRVAFDHDQLARLR